MRFQQLFLAMCLIWLSWADGAHAAAMVNYATLPATECDVSASPSVTNLCSSLNGYTGAVGIPTMAGVIGARSIANSSAATAIDAFGYCRYVNNASGNSLFLPFNTAKEWMSFIANIPTGISFADCSRGGPVTVPAVYGTDPRANMCTTVVTAPDSITAPYKPYYLPSGPGASYIYPTSTSDPSVTFSCKSADGTAFHQTALTTLRGTDSGYGPNSTIGWDIEDVIYTYNGVCGDADGVQAATYPANGLCHVGVATQTTAATGYAWTCSGGDGGGAVASCTSPNSITPGSAIYNVAGIYSFTVPAYNTLTVQVWGAGGGGGSDTQGGAGSQSSFAGTIFAYGGGIGGSAQYYGGNQAGGAGGGASGGSANASGGAGGSATPVVHQGRIRHGNGNGGGGGQSPNGGAGGVGGTGTGRGVGSFGSNATNGGLPGGGGGGGAGQWSGGAGGGGGGGYSSITYSSGQLATGAQIPVVVGAGGTGGVDQSRSWPGGSGAPGQVTITWQ